MFTKKATFTINSKDISALNIPIFGEKFSFISDQQIKVDNQVIYKISSMTDETTASSDKVATFDLEAEINKHPDSLFINVFAIKADETNDNGDYFSKEELYDAVPTFVGVPLFTNHKNSDINEARGRVIHSWWDEENNGISIVARVDAAAYPQLARGIKEEYIIGTSMGCQVAHSLCSICHNYAETPDQYCEHIRERKTRHISSRKQKCCYHKNASEDICSLCGSSKKDIKTFAVDDKAFEYNYGIKFIENSFVVNPACHNCGVTEIIDPNGFRKKVAEIALQLPRLIKEASETNMICTDHSCVKVAGQQEITSLNQALDLLTSVSQAMLQQKDQIDLEFLSDLVKVLSDLQTVTDELAEQGYGRLPSAQEDQAANPEQPGAEPALPSPATPPAPSNVTTGPAGSAGTVTTPLAKKRIELEKLSENVMNLMDKKINMTIELKKNAYKKMNKKHNEKLNIKFAMGKDCQ